jgi:hypothetical protein
MYHFAIGYDYHVAEKVKRAALLIEFCQAKLKSTEEEISQVVAKLCPVKPATGTTGQQDEYDLPF